ncbi:MAG: hypothetical protein R6W70_01390 [bacterium]
MKIVKYHKKLQADISRLFEEIDSLSENVDRRSRNYNKKISNFMNVVGSMFEEVDFSTQVEAVRELLNDLTSGYKKNSDDISGSIDHELLIRYFEKLDLRRLFVLIRIINDNHRRIIQNINEIKYLFQYDDILSQSFYSLEDVIELIKKIHSNELEINSLQLSKLKTLFTTMVISIFDTIEDVFSLFNKKFSKIKSILLESRHSISVVLKILNDGENNIGKIIEKTKMSEKSELQAEKAEALSLFEDGEFLDSLSIQLNDISRRMENLDFKINSLIHKTVIQQVTEIIDNIFEELMGYTEDSASDIDFIGLLSDSFKVSDHKRALFSIFGDSSSCDTLSDGLELF